MADASDTDAVQEASKILGSSNVVVESLSFEDRFSNLRLEMKYHQCKANSNDNRLERRWSLSRVDGLKELVPAIVKSTNLKALSWSFRTCEDPDVVEPLLQGLYTNHTIVTASFDVSTHDVVDKIVVMLCHNTSLKRFALGGEHNLPISGFGKALGMNHTLEILNFFWVNHRRSMELDLEELVQPLIMDENGNQANSTLTSLTFSGFSFVSSFAVSIAAMLRRNSSIKSLFLWSSLEIESDARELIQSLANNHSLETLDLSWCHGVKGTVFPTIMDVLLVNFTLKDIELHGTPLLEKGKDVAINKQLKKNAVSRKLHLMELELAKPTSARVIFCGNPYAAPNGCQGVALVEGVIRTECVKQLISFKQRQDQAILLEDLKQAILTIGSGYQHSWDELSEGGNVIMPVACEFAIKLLGRREIEDLVERGLKEGQIHEVHNAHWDEATMVTREWAGPSSSTRLDSYLELKAKKHIVKVNTPHDAWTKRNRWQEDLQEHDPSPQHHTEIALSELAHEVRHLSTVVQDTHKLLRDEVLSVTKLIRHMVPSPNLEYGKAVVAVGEGVLKDPPVVWATVTPEKLVREEASAIRTTETMASAEQWLVDFLKDKVISMKFGLQRVVYKDAQGRKTGEMGWICKKHFNEGMQVGELEGFAC
ncbi:unnamed protein product [Sphagnum balticum]